MLKKLNDLSYSDKTRQRLGLSGVAVLLTVITGAFWWQEWQYLLPTPVPEHYQPVFSGDTLSASILKRNRIKNTKKATFLHFFSPYCPCSRFNIAHVRYLVERYGDEVNFYAVVFNDSEYEMPPIDFAEKYDVPIPTRTDKDDQIAAACGVYATPQAAIITPDGRLFYRGNYNLSRYCTDRSTNFAEQALGALLDGKNPPDFGKNATRAYGCELPEGYFKPQEK